jgi:hypothetical protein
LTGSHPSRLLACEMPDLPVTHTTLHYNVVI